MNSSRFKKGWFLVFILLNFTSFLIFPMDVFQEALQKGIKLRSRPLLDFPIKKEFHVRDFGAIADDRFPDTEAIQSAIEAAIRSQVPARVVFDRGVYRLNFPGGRDALRIEDASDLIIDGRGCEFVLMEPDKQLIGLRNSKRIILKDFSVDFEVLPHTQGWITAVDRKEGMITVRLDPNFPDLDQPHFRKADYKWGFIKDRNNPVAFKEGTEYRLYLTEWTKIADHTYRLKVRHKIKLQTVEVGDPYVQISRIDGALFHASRCEDVTFLNLRIYCSSNALFATSYCSRPNFIRINASPRQGRWLTSGADGCFNFGGREGPWVEDCYFESLGDDNLVIKGYRAYCVNVVDPYTFDLVHATLRFVRPQPNFEFYRKQDKENKWMVKPGDTLTVLDPVKREIVANPVVVEVASLDYGVRVKVDRRIPDLRPGTDYENSLSFFNEDACLPGFVVINNVFKSAVRFGCLVKSHDGMIAGNLFERHSDQSICILNTYQEFNGIPSNLLIKDNTFKLASGWPVKTAQTAQHKLNPNRNIFGVVQSSVNWPVGQWDIEEAAFREIRNISIENNRFINWWQNPAVVINNGLHVVIRGNYFELDEYHAQTALTGVPLAIKIVNSTDVQVADNVLNGPNLNPKEGIKIISSTAVRLKNNRKSQR